MAWNMLEWDDDGRKSPMSETMAFQCHFNPWLTMKHHQSLQGAPVRQIAQHWGLHNSKKPKEIHDTYIELVFMGNFFQLSHHILGAPAIVFSWNIFFVDKKHQLYNWK